MAGDRARSLDHFEIGEAVAVAEVVGPAAQPIKRFERQDMGLGQIGDMDIVAHAGAIPRRVIAAEDRHAVALAERHLEHHRDEVPLRDRDASPRSGVPPAALK